MAQCDTLMETVPSIEGTGTVTRLKAVYYETSELSAELLAVHSKGFNVLLTNPKQICVGDEFSYSVFFLDRKIITGSSKALINNCRGLYIISYFQMPELFEHLRQQPVAWIMIIDGTHKFMFELTNEQAAELMAIAKCAAQEK